MCQLCPPITMLFIHVVLHKVKITCLSARLNLGAVDPEKDYLYFRISTAFKYHSPQV